MIERAKERVSFQDTCFFERKSLTAWHEGGFSGDHGLWPWEKCVRAFGVGMRPSHSGMGWGEGGAEK